MKRRTNRGRYRATAHHSDRISKMGIRRVDNAVGVAAQLDVVMALSMSFLFYVRNALAAFAVFVAIFCSGSAWSGTSDGYRVASSCSFGDSGTLQLLLDKAVTKRVLDSHWKTGIWDGTEPRPALLRWLTADGSVQSTLDLEHPLARLTRRNSVPDEPPRVTIDLSAGLGSYSGPVTRWVVQQDGLIRWAKTIDDQGREVQVSVMESLKTAWKRQRRKDGHLDIFEAACRPQFKQDEQGNELFSVTYKHYRFDQGTWSYSSRTESGFWEMDGDFPSESAFP